MSHSAYPRSSNGKRIIDRCRARVELCIMKWLLLGCAFAVAPIASSEPVSVKVVVVAMFEPGEDTGDRPGELQFWVEREGLARSWDFPAGQRPLRSNEDGSVLAVLTGIGTIRAASTIIALGLDPRFDFSKTYLLVAGIAGVDPHDAPLGSAIWADYVVDGDLAHEIDFREVPTDWPTGYLPLRKKVPYEPPADPSEGMMFRLDPALVDWAFELTRNIPLDDSAPMQRRRKLYEGFPNAQQPPLVLRGDNLSASTYWHGAYLNRWANDWVRYFTGDAGNYGRPPWRTRARCTLSRCSGRRAARTHRACWCCAPRATSTCSGRF